MDFVQLLPVEILEEIFLYLNCRDLKKCSQVSRQWRDVINSNKIWIRKCAVKKHRDKIFLDASMSGVRNPTKRYQDHSSRFYSSNLSPPCHWRSHYDRYQFLERNWQRGIYCIHPLPLNPMHYSDGLILGRSNMRTPKIDELSHNKLCLYDVSKFESVNSGIFFLVDNVVFKNGCLIYSYDHEISCQVWNKANQKFVEQYAINAREFTDESETLSTSSFRFKCSDPCLSFQSSRRSHLVTHSSSQHFILRIHDLKTGAFIKQVDLRHFTGPWCSRFTLEDCLGDKVYVQYENYDHWCILQYDYAEERLNAKIEVPGQPSIVTSRNFFCAKIVHNHFVVSCELQVWSSHAGTKVAVYCTDKQSTPILTPCDKIIYCEDQQVFIRGLLGDFTLSIRMPDQIKGLCQVRGEILVCKLRHSIQMLDLTTGEKLYCLYRHAFEGMWADDRAVVVKSTFGDSYAFVFW